MEFGTGTSSESTESTSTELHSTGPTDSNFEYNGPILFVALKAWFIVYVTICCVILILALLTLQVFFTLIRRFCLGKRDKALTKQAKTNLKKMNSDLMVDNYWKFPRVTLKTHSKTVSNNSSEDNGRDNLEYIDDTMLGNKAEDRKCMPLSDQIHKCLSREPKLPLRRRIQRSESFDSLTSFSSDKKIFTRRNDVDKPETTGICSISGISSELCNHRNASERINCSKNKFISDKVYIETDN